MLISEKPVIAIDYETPS